MQHSLVRMANQGWFRCAPALSNFLMGQNIDVNELAGVDQGWLHAHGADCATGDAEQKRTNPVMLRTQHQPWLRDAWLSESRQLVRWCGVFAPPFTDQKREQDLYHKKAKCLLKNAETSSVCILKYCTIIAHHHTAWFSADKFNNWHRIWTRVNWTAVKHNTIKPQRTRRAAPSYTVLWVQCHFWSVFVPRKMDHLRSTQNVAKQCSYRLINCHFQFDAGCIFDTVCTYSLSSIEPNLKHLFGDDWNLYLMVNDCWTLLFHEFLFSPEWGNCSHWNCKLFSPLGEMKDTVICPQTLPNSLGHLGNLQILSNGCWITTFSEDKHSSGRQASRNRAVDPTAS